MVHGTNKKMSLLVPLQRLFVRRVKTGGTGRNEGNGEEERIERIEKIDALDILDDLELAEP